MTKATLFTALLAIAGTGFAVPASDNKGYQLRSASELSQEATETAVPMVVTGPVFVGGPDLTFTGTAESVYRQILELNPDYNAWDFPKYQEMMAERGVTREAFEAKGLSKRSDVLSKRDRFECNPSGYEVGNWPMQCSEGLDYLSKLNAQCGAPAGRGGCSRVSCSHNCGIFLCNDNPFPISVHCMNIGGDAWNIIETCQYSYNEWVVSVKGQVFRDMAPGWNTIVKESGC